MFYFSTQELDYGVFMIKKNSFCDEFYHFLVKDKIYSYLCNSVIAPHPIFRSAHYGFGSLVQGIERRFPKP